MPKSAPELGAALSDYSWQTRVGAAVGLRELGLRSTNITLNEISRNLEDPNWRVRDAAASCFGALSSSGFWHKQWKKPVKSKEAVSELLFRMSDTHLGIRRSASSALEMLETTGSFGDLRESAAPCIPRLLERLGAEDWPQRVMAATVLGAAGPLAIVAVPALIRSLVDSSFAVRTAARETLDTMVADAIVVDRHAMGAIAVGDLAKGLSDAEWQVRVSACWALGRHGAVNVLQLPQLFRELKHDDWAVRALAAELIGNAGTIGAAGLPRLAATLDDSDKNVKSAAREAVRSFQEAADAGQDPIGRMELDKLLKQMSHWDLSLRERSRESLIKSGLHTTPGIAELSKILQDPRRDVGRGAQKVLERLKTLGSLGELDDEAAAVQFVPQLLAALEDEDNWLLRLTAAEALGNLAVVASKVFSTLQELSQREPDSEDMARCMAGRQILRRLEKRGAMVNPREIAQKARKELVLASYFEGKENRALKVMAQELLLTMADCGLIKRPKRYNRQTVAQLRQTIPSSLQGEQRIGWREPPPPTPKDPLKPGRGSGIHLPKPILDEAHRIGHEKQRLVREDKFVVCDKHCGCAEQLKRASIPHKLVFTMKIRNFDHRRAKESFLAEDPRERADWQQMESALRDGIARAAGAKATEVVIAEVEVAFGAMQVVVELFEDGLGQDEAEELVQAFGSPKAFAQVLRGGIMGAARGASISLDRIEVFDMIGPDVVITRGTCSMMPRRPSMSDLSLHDI